MTSRPHRGLVRVVAELDEPVVLNHGYGLHLDGLLLSGATPAQAGRIPLPRIEHAGAWVYACTDWLLPRSVQPEALGDGSYRWSTERVAWLAAAKRKPLRDLVRKIRRLGVARRDHGRVRAWSVENVHDDVAEVLVRRGRAARFLPAAWTSQAGSPGRWRPPYWEQADGDRIDPGRRCELAPDLVLKVRRLAHVEYRGETLVCGRTYREWADALELPLRTVQSRILRHGDPRVSHLPRVTVAGLTLREAAAKLGISYNAAKKRHARGTLAAAMEGQG